jgi:hypothetical protein
VESVARLCTHAAEKKKKKKMFVVENLFSEAIVAWHRTSDQQAPQNRSR